MVSDDLLARRPFYPITHRLPNISVYLLIRLTDEMVGDSIRRLLDLAVDDVGEYLDHRGNGVIHQDLEKTFMYSSGGVRLLVESLEGRQLTYRTLSDALITLVDYMYIHSSAWSTAQFEIHDGPRTIAVGKITPVSDAAIFPRQAKGRKCQGTPDGET